MPEHDTTTLDIRVERAPEGAKPFIPSEDRERVEFVLEPEPVTPTTFQPFFPQVSRFKAIPFIAPEKRSIVLNIEATSVMPFEGRIICITVRNPADADGEPFTFVAENEEMIVQAFIEWYEEQGIEELIGYNIAYDFRYIFTKCMRYQIRADLFTEADLYDMMQVMQQVKREFVPGFNKPGTLDQWSKFLWGQGKLMTNREMLQAWGEGRVNDIVTFNEDNVDKIFRLWLLAHFVFAGHGLGIKGEAEAPAEVPVEETAAIAASRAAGEASHTDSSNPMVQCITCLQAFDLEHARKIIKCTVCGTDLPLQ